MSSVIDELWAVSQDLIIWTKIGIWRPRYLCKVLFKYWMSLLQMEILMCWVPWLRKHVSLQVTHCLLVFSVTRFTGQTITIVFQALCQDITGLPPSMCNHSLAVSQAQGCLSRSPAIEEWRNRSSVYIRNHKIQNFGMLRQTSVISSFFGSALSMPGRAAATLLNSCFTL